MSERTLLLMRHAKSDYPAGVVDHERPLAPRGIREARLAGETLSRTGLDAPVTFADRLYDAVPGTVIDEINSVDDDIATLLVIGHEPAMSNVTLGLAGTPGSSQAAAERVSTKFPTSAIAVLRTDNSWRDLTLGVAALITFHVPR